MDKRDCFAYGYSEIDGCKVLIRKNCDKCNFYKTPAQLAEEKKRCEERIKSIYGVNVKTFLELKRRNSNA